MVGAVHNGPKLPILLLLNQKQIQEYLKCFLFLKLCEITVIKRSSTFGSSGGTGIELLQHIGPTPSQTRLKYLPRATLLILTMTLWESDCDNNLSFNKWGNRGRPEVACLRSDTWHFPKALCSSLCLQPLLVFKKNNRKEREGRRGRRGGVTAVVIPPAGTTRPAAQPSSSSS